MASTKSFPSEHRQQRAQISILMPLTCQVRVSDLNDCLLILLSSSHLTPKLLYHAWRRDNKCTRDSNTWTTRQLTYIIKWTINQSHCHVTTQKKTSRRQSKCAKPQEFLYKSDFDVHWQEIGKCLSMIYVSALHMFATFQTIYKLTATVKPAENHKKAKRWHNKFSLNIMPLNKIISESIIIKLTSDRSYLTNSISFYVNP